MYGLYAVFKWVVTTSFMASVLIFTLLFVKKLFGRKLGVTWHYYIWILLFIRLLVPFVPHSSFSVFNLISPMVESRVQPADYGVQKDTSADLALKEASDYSQNDTINDSVTSNEDNNSLSSTPYVIINFNSILMIIWLLGIFVFFFHIFILNIRFKKRISDQHQCTDVRITTVFSKCREDMNINAQIPVMLTENVHSPSICGTVRPKLLMPDYLTGEISTEELKYIFLHELAHFKQKDIWINWIATALKAIHWFNPIIWYGFYQMRQDCELACDAIALSHIEQENQIQYGQTIIHLLSILSIDRYIPGTAGILTSYGKKQIKRRITMIANFKKVTVNCVVAVVAIASAIGITVLTDAKPTVANNIESNSNIISQVNTEKNLLPQNAKDTATLWAEGLSRRNGGLRFSLLSKELKTQEFERYSKVRWTIGGSSPWVVSYTVDELNKIDNDTSEFEINYKLTTSEGKYTGQEKVTVKKFGSSFFVIKHDKYPYDGYPFDAITNPEYTRDNSLDIQRGQKRKESSLVSRDIEGAVNQWAEALKYRNGSVRFALLKSNLRDQEYEKYSKMNWVIGGSSPHVTDYTIKQLNKIDDNTYEYEIDYTLTDSTKATYFSKENITLTRIRDWVISKHDDYDYLPEITK